VNWENASLKEAIGKLLEHCTEEMGFQTPFYLATVSANGAAMFIRFNVAEDGDGVKGERLAGTDGQNYELPVNLFVSDSRGEAARMLIAKSGKPGPVLRLIQGGVT
jgi:hypothetical protein